MEIQVGSIKGGQAAIPLDDVSTPSGLSLRSKSSIRIGYEAEAEVLRRKLGDLESIRSQLGLSQRKICQLLMVDPSAWSRWSRDGGQAPPHVFRALQWYLALQEKYPALDVNFWLSTAPRAQKSQIHDSAWKAASVEIEGLRREVEQLREKMEGDAESLDGPPRAAAKEFGLAFLAGIIVGAGIALALVFI